MIRSIDTSLLMLVIQSVGASALCAALSVQGDHFVGDLNIPGPGSVNVAADFSGINDIAGIGVVTDWTAVVADNENGLFPWSLDLRLTVTSPDSTALVWDPIGGDVTIADYPLADFSPAYPTPQPSGTYDVQFSTPGVPNPWVSGLRDTTLYALSEVADVVTPYDGSVASGPTWNRPFFIAGISGLGPVVYDVLPVTVDVSGGYSFESVVSSGNNFNFLYRGDFDPALPLDNLLDYGLGNGNAPNGTPQGTSRIDALLMAGEQYYYVTSQFDRFSPGQDFETTITGPGGILIVDPLFGDFNDDSLLDCLDVDSLVAEIVAGTDNPLFDLDGDGLVDQVDLQDWLAIAGATNLPSQNPHLPGDINLDGRVDGLDFLVWNAQKFTATPAWCDGDVDASGVVDGADFIIWNQHKFQVADTHAVPESCLSVLPLLVCFLRFSRAVETQRREEALIALRLCVFAFSRCFVCSEGNAKAQSRQGTKLSVFAFSRMLCGFRKERKGAKCELRKQLGYARRFFAIDRAYLK